MNIDNFAKGCVVFRGIKLFNNMATAFCKNGLGSEWKPTGVTCVFQNQPVFSNCNKIYYFFISSMNMISLDQSIPLFESARPSSTIQGQAPDKKSVSKRMNDIMGDYYLRIIPRTTKNGTHKSNFFQFDEFLTIFKPLYTTGKTLQKIKFVSRKLICRLFNVCEQPFLGTVSEHRCS